jgi:uncharacterized protein (DUF433 family)
MKRKLSPPPLANDLHEVATNIRTYSRQMSRPELLKGVAKARVWCAIRSDHDWIFGHARFVAYPGMDAAKYSRLREDRGIDGRPAVHRLEEWFVELGPEDKLGRELMKRLKDLVSRHGKVLNKLARIWVLKEEAGPKYVSQPSALPSGETWRITADPAILSGKPCIRGMRIRVADVLELLAGGASREEILTDFPYLEDGDITAALEYAAGAVDHRLIKAA